MTWHEENELIRLMATERGKAYSVWRAEMKARNELELRAVAKPPDVAAFEEELKRFWNRVHADEEAKKRRWELRRPYIGAAVAGAIGMLLFLIIVGIVPL